MNAKISLYLTFYTDRLTASRDFEQVRNFKQNKRKNRTPEMPCLYKAEKSCYDKNRRIIRIPDFLY